jgi:hypothetical protein
MPLRVTKGIAIQPPAKRAEAAFAAIMLDVPYVTQLESEWCWAACTQMVAAFLGNSNVQQCELANFLHGQADCCDNPDSDRCNQPCPYEGIGQVYQHLRINCISQTWAVNIQVLVREFTAQRPVEIGYLWYNGGGHVAILRGITDTGLIAVNDPAFGTGFATYAYLANAYGAGQWAYSFGDFRNL